MSLELPTLTRDDLTVSSSIQDQFLTKIRGLVQTNSNCNPILDNSPWNANIGHTFNSSLGSNITGTITSANGTLPTPGYTYTTTHTTVPYTIGTGIGTLGNGPTIGPSPNVSLSSKITMTGEKADIEINGKSMVAWMEKVEQRLNILQPNPDLEKDWDELRRLGERYKKLEKKCQEKSRMWETLKKMPPPKL